MTTLRYFFVGFLAMGTANAQMLRLDEAVSGAVQKNYGVAVFQQREQLAQTANTKGNAGLLPSISATLQPNAVINGVNQEFFGGLRPPLVQSGIFNRNFNGNIQAAWTLYDGKNRSLAQEMLGEGVRIAQTQTRQAVENLIASVSVVYYDIIRQNQRIEALDNALVISRERRRIAKDRYEVGQGSKLDYLNASVDFNEDTTALINQKLTLRNAKSLLNQLMVRNLAMAFTTEDTILITSDLSYQFLKENMLRQNPGVLLAKQNKQLAGLERRTQEGQLLPQIDLVGGYNYNAVLNGGSGFGVQRGHSTALNAGVRASVNIFDGYNQRRRIQEAKISQEITNIQEEDTRWMLEGMLERSFEGYSTNLQLLQVEIQNLVVANQNIAIALERYKIGVATPLELREAQRNAVATETRFIEAEFNAKIAEIELLRLAGLLLK